MPPVKQNKQHLKKVLLNSFHSEWSQVRISSTDSKIARKIRQPSVIFGNLRKFSENDQKCSYELRTVFQEFSKIFGKCSEIFGKLHLLNIVVYVIKRILYVRLSIRILSSRYFTRYLTALTRISSVQLIKIRIHAWACNVLYAQHNKQHRRKVLLSRFYLNGHRMK